MTTPRSRATDAHSDEPLSPRWRQRFRRRLLRWYAAHARDLPWRGVADPYRVWISEIMLQQTQVETVRPYFERFLEAFPDVRTLAAAPERQVLRLWEGLGYYRRARQLHEAAAVIVEKHQGRFPENLEHVRALPGVGRYTAGAILSIALDQRQPILEANTIRLLSRVIGYRDDPRRAAGQRTLWGAAERLLPRKQVGRFNQALMELGSLVCQPREPACAICPVAALCVARLGGLQDEIPLAAAKQRFTDLHEAAVVVRRRGRLLLRRCAEGERWAGLWDFPRFGVNEAQGAARRRELVDSVLRQTGVTVGPTHLLATIRHGVTRYRITLDCHAADYLSGRIHSVNGARLVWIKPSELDEYPLSATGRKICRLIA